MNKLKKVGIILGSIVVTIALFIGIVNLFPCYKVESTPFTKVDKPIISAHRGGAELNPENTEKAFDYVILETTYSDAIEFDIRLTKDNVAVIIHDDYIDEYDYDIDKVLPNYEPALYLEDKNVQNVHALCHIGNTDYCEYLQWKGRVNAERSFDGEGYFPESFVALCQDILSGQTTRMYDEIKVDNPHYAYPIRFFGKQYIIMPSAGEKKTIPMESISREQICSEGYIGAVRNTMYGNLNIKERIVKINLVKEEIYAKQEYNKYIKTQSFHRKYLVQLFQEFCFLSHPKQSFHVLFP